jgi:uncharacterized protein YjbJ (UPF0337 family)
MSGTFNTLKGKIHEAFGVLTGNKRLKTKGKVEQAVGKVETNGEQAVDQVRDEAKEKIGAAKDKAEDAVKEAKDT